MTGGALPPRQGTEAPAGRVAAERIASARAEQALRDELERADARSVALRREVEVLRSSESFRIGHALVTVLGKRVLMRPSALVRGAVAALPPRRARDVAATTRRLPRRWWPSERGDTSSRPQRRNTALFVAWGADEERLIEYAERVARLQTMLVDLEPVFLVDTTAIGPLHAHGYRCEYVIALDEWRLRRPPYEWAEYVTERVAELRSVHQPRAVVVFEREDVMSALEQGVLNAIVLPSIGSGDDNRV